MKTSKIILSVVIAIILFAGNSLANCNFVSSNDKSKTHSGVKEIEPTYSFLAKQAVFIPFTMVYDHFLIVEVTINGEKLNFLFDESSLFTTINKEKADLLGVTDETKLFIGNQSFAGEMVVSDFTKLKASGLDVDGIIGSSIVDYYNIIFDLAQGKIICTPF